MIEKYEKAKERIFENMNGSLTCRNLGKYIKIFKKILKQPTFLLHIIYYITYHLLFISFFLYSFLHCFTTDFSIIIYFAIYNT